MGKKMVNKPPTNHKHLRTEAFADLSRRRIGASEIRTFGSAEDPRDLPVSYWSSPVTQARRVPLKISDMMTKLLGYVKQKSGRDPLVET